MKKQAYQTYDVFSAIHPDRGAGSQEYYLGIGPLVSGGKEGITGHPGALGGDRTRLAGKDGTQVNSFKRRRKGQKPSYLLKKAAGNLTKVVDNSPQHAREESQMSQDMEHAGQMIAEAFHDELKKIAEMEKGAQLGAAIKGLVKGIGAAGKAGVTAGKRSLRATAGGKRGVISRYAKAGVTGAKRFGKQLTPGQLATVAGGTAGAAGLGAGYMTKR